MNSYSDILFFEVSGIESNFEVSSILDNLKV